MNQPSSEPPRHARDAANFAASVARQYVENGGEAKDLFVAFAGLVSASDPRIAADCLLAMEETVLARRA